MKKSKTKNRTEEYIQKIEQHLQKLKENFNNGKTTYKDFRELCDFFEIDYVTMSSDSIPSFKNQLKRYCNFRKVGNSHNLEIIEIYQKAYDEEPIKRPRKSDYATNMYPLIVHILYKKFTNTVNVTSPYPSVTYSKSDLYNELGLANKWRKYFDELYEPEATMLEEFYDDSWGILNQVLSRSLDYLPKEDGIICQQLSMIYDFRESNSEVAIVADEETQKIIDTKKKEVLKKYNCKTEREFNQRYYYKLFQISLNKFLKDDNIEFLYPIYKISLTPNDNNTGIIELYEKTFPNMNWEQIQEKLRQCKYEINKRIIPQIKHKNEKEAHAPFYVGKDRTIEYADRRQEIFDKIYKILPPMHSRNAEIDFYLQTRNKFTEEIIDITE